MLDIALIRKNPEEIAQRIRLRGADVNFDKLLRLDDKKRKFQTQAETKKAERNRVSAEIAKLKKQNKNPDEMIAEMQKLGAEISLLDAKTARLEQQIFDIMSALPNPPLPEVQEGGKEANKTVRTFGKKPEFEFTPKNHVELCTSLGLIDYERAAKISGTGTWVYTGLGAQLEWALLNYFVDFHIKNGYTLIMPPHLLNYESGYCAGQFPKFQDEVFITDFDKDPKKSKFLLPTAETALINLHRNEIIPAEKLPIRYAGYSPCYRKEAGSYRTSERGMIRGFQFNKIEMFIYCLTDDSPKFFDELVRNAEKLVEGLGLHFQTAALAAGDLGPVMAKTFDIEVYIPSMGGYKEVSSCSTAMDYQARRANIRTKVNKHFCDEKGCRIQAVNEYVHTLNASGLATSRLIPAIVEQFQTKDGSVNIPVILQKYMHEVKIIEKPL
jgi:seryl-tRNA synthetase